MTTVNDAAHTILAHDSGEYFSAIPLNACMDRELGDSEYRLYGYLVGRWGGAKKGIFPKISTIADDLHWSASKVKRVLAGLAKSGWVRIDSGKKAGKSNFYHPAKTAGQAAKWSTAPTAAATRSVRSELPPSVNSELPPRSDLSQEVDRGTQVEVKKIEPTRLAPQGATAMEGTPRPAAPEVATTDPDSLAARWGSGDRPGSAPRISKTNDSLPDRSGTAAHAAEVDHAKMDELMAGGMSAFGALLEVTGNAEVSVPEGRVRGGRAGSDGDSGAVERPGGAAAVRGQRGRRGHDLHHVADSRPGVDHRLPGKRAVPAAGR